MPGAPAKVSMNVGTKPGLKRDVSVLCDSRTTACAVEAVAAMRNEMSDFMADLETKRLTAGVAYWAEEGE